MVNIFRGYVLTKDKKPIQKFKNVENLLSYEEANQSEEFAGILNSDFVVLDVDDGEEAERTYRLVCHLNLNCRVVNTSRGKHFIFRKNPQLCLKGTTHNINALGITFDIRIGVNQYIVVKYEGKIREVIRDFDENRDIDVYPKYFAPIASSDKFTGLGDGSGRNGKLFSHIATLTRCGFTKEETIDICDWINEFIFAEPLSESEMKTITRDEAFTGLDFTGAKEDFAELPQANTTTYRPTNCTELAMAELFAAKNIDSVRFNSGTGWLVWNGKVWLMSELKAVKKYTQFLKRVMALAKADLIREMSNVTPDKDRIAAAQGFCHFVEKMEDGNKISSVLKIARSFMEIDVDELDSNPFDLNTPDGIVNLKTGEIRPHDSLAYCTKITRVSPSDVPSPMWEELLDTVTCNDAEFKNYLQYLGGVIVLARVYQESLILILGNGSNGKSTLFNTIYNILGNYAGKIPAESLTTKAKNVKVDLAELFGKRFVLASETEEGMRLSNAMLKQIASTDPITAEKKYKDPFTFIPTHTAVLYTNFLPSLGSMDNGTRRRIIVCPFNAKIDKPKKDFADNLIKTSGGAILNWLIQGAIKFIASSFTLPSCKVCEDSREEYLKDNDWLSRFLSDCCNVGELEKQNSGVLYKAYRQWCIDVGEYAKRASDFAHALQNVGFKSKRTNKGVEWSGLSLDGSRDIGKVVESDLL